MTKKLAIEEDEDDNSLMSSLEFSELEELFSFVHSKGNLVEDAGDKRDHIHVKILLCDEKNDF